MKNKMFFMLAFMLTSMVFSQSQDNYENVLKIIKKGFNENNSSLIHEKFDSNLKSSLDKDNFKKMIDSLYTNKGIMQSYEFILEDNKEKNYLVEFENASLLIVLIIENTGEISTFKIKDY